MRPSRQSPCGKLVPLLHTVAVALIGFQNIFISINPGHIFVLFLSLPLPPSVPPLPSFPLALLPPPSLIVLDEDLGQVLCQQMGNLAETLAWLFSWSKNRGQVCCLFWKARHF